MNYQTAKLVKLRSRLKSASKSRPKLIVPAGIEDLICGISIETDEYVDKDYVGTVKRLRVDVRELDPQISHSIQNNKDLPSSAIFPFLARKFLELSMTSLLARIDPIRVIAARKNQLDASYQIGRQNLSSVAWNGDIFSKSKASASDNPWSADSLSKGIERSLLGSHILETSIAPSLRWLADQNSLDSEWLRELGNQDQPLNWLKQRLMQVYSELSKGVHAEYLLDEDTTFDDSSIRLYAGDCYMLVLILATATHRSPFFLRSLPIEKAFDSFRHHESRIRNLIQ